MRPDHIMENALVRMAMIKKNELEDKTTVDFLRLQKKIEKRSISMAAEHMAEGIPDNGTYLTPRFIEDNKVNEWFNSVSW